MSRRSKETLAVQLFPFLAVLVCTMGSLIFLLLVTTREIRQRAVAFAAYQLAQTELAQVPSSPRPLMSVPRRVPAVVEVLEPEPEPVIDDGYDAAFAERERELSDLKATWRLRANLLAKDRDQQRSLLARRRSAIETEQEKTTLLQAEVERLEVELGRLAGDAAASTQINSDAERILLEQQIAAMKKRLRDAQAAEATSQNDKFQVVPFDPQTGTSRRPILIECTEAGIRFLPEDILISAKDLEGFTHRANPLAAGTGALINYWTVWNMQQRQPHAENGPYVLMLVRPGGVYAYYVALKMLEPIRTAQGYELIEESTVLKLPEVDMGAKTACQTAVNRLLAEREQIYRAAVNGGSAASVFGGGGTGRGRSGSAPSFGPGPGDVSGEREGGRRGGGNRFTLDDVTGGENAVGTRSWERIENFQGRPNGQRRGDAVARGDRDLSNGGLKSNGALKGEKSGDKRGSAAASETPDASETAGLEKSRSTRSGKTSGSSGGNSTNSDPSSQDGGFSDPSLWGSDEPEPGMPIGERPGRNSRNGTTADGELTDDESLAENDDGSDFANGSRTEPATGGSSGAGSTPSSKSSRLSDNGSAGSRFSHDSKNATRAPRTGEKPSKSTDNADKPLEPEMLAGRRWGLCDAGASIGFEREVRVDVSKDKIVIAEKHVVPMGQGESKQETLEQFAVALDLYSREWGRPPQGFFWAPRLKFIVKPEANGNYEQVNAMMTRAGLSTSHEFAKDARAVQYGRTNPTPLKPPTFNPATTRPAPKTAASPKEGGRQ